jgi:hypothetical protein
MCKVFELEFYLRDNHGQTRPYEDTVCLILVPGSLSNSMDDLEKSITGMVAPENIMIKTKHTKDVELISTSPFDILEALFIKGYRFPNDSLANLEEIGDIFYKPSGEDRHKGRTYLVGSIEDIVEVRRQIWKHFDIGLRFTLSESSIRERSLNHRMYGGF